MAPPKTKDTKNKVNEVKPQDPAKKAGEKKKWTRVNSLEVKTGIDDTNGHLMFPTWDPLNDGEKYVKVTPDNECSRIITIDLNTNFAVIATDSGNTEKFINLAGSLVQIGPGVAPITVINKAGEAIKTFGEALNHETVPAHQEFHFPVHLCCDKMYQPVNVSMEVSGRVYISWKSDSDYVELDMHLRAGADGSADVTRTLRGKKGNGEPHSFTETLGCGIVTDGDLVVNVWFNEFCSVDWGPGMPSIAMVKFDHVKLKIESPPECVEGKAPAFTPLPKESPKSGEFNVSDTVPNDEKSGKGAPAKPGPK